MATQIATADIKDYAVTAIKLAAGTVATFSNVSQGRLTLTSNTPVTTSDVLAASSLYYTPHQGSGGGEVITLWDGSALKYYIFTQKTLNIASFLANKNYDIWGYPSAGDLALDSSVWTSDTARATAIALQNNMWTKSGDPTRKLLGTIRIGSVAGQCEDSKTKRFVSNLYNRVGRTLFKSFQWSLPTTTSQVAGYWNLDTTQILDFVNCLDIDPVKVSQIFAGYYGSTSLPSKRAYIGLDAYTSTDGVVTNNGYGQDTAYPDSELGAEIVISAGIGRHFIGLGCSHGTGASTEYLSGIAVGEVMG